MYMVSINFGDRTTNIPCFESKHPYKDTDGKVTRKFSDPVWMSFQLSVGKEISDIELKLNFDLQRNNDVPALHSKGAFFVPHLDSPIDAMGQVGEFEYKIDGHDARVCIDDWEFGSKPRIRLKFPDGKGCKNLQLLLGFIGAISNRTNPRRMIYVDLEYRCIKRGAAHFADDYEVHTSLSYDFKSGNRPRASDMFVEIWKDHNVFNVNGNGNSIHPKQTLTIRGISKYIGRWRNQEKINIAYIGTDSTENISSLLRALKAQNHIKKIGGLSIFYDEAWDEHQLYRIKGQENNIAGVVSDTKLIKMVEDVTNPDKYLFYDHDDFEQENSINLERVDLIVSTYVAPWADGSNHSRSRYKNLIETLWIRNKTALISVDPISGSNIFRSTPNHFNLQRLYAEELNLTNRMNYVKMGSEVTYSVECILYKDPKGGIVNG